MTSNQSWQDRRGMSQRGKEVHEPSSPTVKKFHETGANSTIANAVRRASISSTGSGSPADKGPGNAGGQFPTASPGGGGRRRSSAASGGLFNNLTNAKRGSEDYGERRASHQDMAGGGGIVSGWFNSTFKGYQKPADNQKQEPKKGVME